MINNAILVSCVFHMITLWITIILTALKICSENLFRTIKIANGRFEKSHVAGIRDVRTTNARIRLREFCYLLFITLWPK